MEVLKGSALTWEDEFRFFRSDGSVGLSLDIGYIERDESGQPLRMIGVMSDITEQRAAVLALKESEERFRQLATAIHFKFGFAAWIEGEIAKHGDLITDYAKEMARWCAQLAEGHTYFEGLALDRKLAEADSEAWCGVQVIDLNTGACVHWFRIDGPVAELYDVGVVPDVERPMSLSFASNDILALTTHDPLGAGGIPG